MATNPLALAYLQQGGRLIVDPRGKLEAVGNFAWMTADDPRTARRSFSVCRRFFRRLRNERFAGAVKCLVVRDGHTLPDGWLELCSEARQGSATA
jgi:hypothetical protein